MSSDDALDQAAPASELPASSQLLARIIATSRDCIKVLDLEGRLLFMNEGGMLELEICELGTVLNSSWIEFWQGEDREATRAAVEAARNGKTERFTGFFPTVETRTPKWFEVIVSPILNSSGEPERLLAVYSGGSGRDRSFHVNFCDNRVKNAALAAIFRCCCQRGL